MIPIIIYFLSIGLQFGAAIFALLLIRITGRKLAWIFISLAMLLMAARRVVSFVSFLRAGKEITLNIPEILALLVSCLIFAGVWLIREYFHSFKSAEDSLRASEEKNCKLLETALREIEGRKKIEEALRESENISSAITNTAMDAIIMINNEGNISYWNPAAEEMFGYASMEAMGKDMHSLIVPERHQEACKKGFSRFKNTGDGPVLGKILELFALKKDKAEFPIELSISAIQLKGRWHAVGIVRDISARKHLELQLMQAQKMEAIGQLAGGVAHDFNNILTAIMGYGNILQIKIGADNQLTNYVRDILASAEKAANLTHSLLAFSRKQIINPRPVDLNDIIKGVERFLGRIIGEDVELKAVLTQDAIIVLADSGQIEQVLMNLATNARDAMPDGGSLTIETDLIELDNEFVKRHGYGESGLYAFISVTDTGMGMDNTTKGRIFEPFFTTKEMGRGTGLGLAIVYGIIKQHNGFINVYSEYGKGTTFKIYLPVIDTVIDKRGGAASDAALAKGGTETVLIAEDDTAVRGLTKEVLESSGYKVIEAENGEDAINRFLENKDNIQIVILDVIMPKKNGREAYDEIKRIKPDIKALFTSGYTADIVHRKGVLEEGLNFVSKPISPNSLLKKVREVLDMSRENL